jgi:molybdopterin-biosynthesis enzyme MoeA-like protein
MKAMFENVVEEFKGEPRYVEQVYTTEPESALVPRLQEVQERFDVTIGSYPGDGVRLKLTGSDEQTVEVAAEWLRERVERDE